jgi:TonB family protein
MLRRLAFSLYLLVLLAVPAVAQEPFTLCTVSEETGNPVAESLIQVLRDGAPFDLRTAGADGCATFAGGSTASEASPDRTGLSVSAPYPNPTAGAVALEVQTDRPGALRAEVFDVRGRQVWAADVTVATGRQQVRLDLPPGAPGVLFVRLRQGGRTRVVSLVRARDAAAAGTARPSTTTTLGEPLAPRTARTGGAEFEVYIAVIQGQATGEFFGRSEVFALPERRPLLFELAPVVHETEPVIFDVVEQPPELVGGLDGIQNRLVYPPFAVQAGIEGTVFVQFVVDEEGRVRDGVAVRSPNELLSSEALRLTHSASFEPGLQQGRPVKVRYTLPILFRLR